MNCRKMQFFYKLYILKYIKMFISVLNISIHYINLTFRFDFDFKRRIVYAFLILGNIN
jgi:hypothetical protein